MHSNIKLTAGFAIIYSGAMTAGISLILPGSDQCCSDGPRHAGLLLALQTGMLVEYSLLAGAVLALIATTALVRYTPDYWSYARVGIALWLSMTVPVLAVMLACHFGGASLLALHGGVTALCLWIMTARLKHLRLTNAIRARLAAREAAEAAAGVNELAALPFVHAKADRGMLY